MSNKRMNHVFNEMVVKSGRDIDTAELHFINGGISATFFCTQQAIHTAHAINNHDRMVEEIEELRGALKLLIGKGIDLLNAEDANDEEDAASVHANFNDAIIKSEQLLSKLNQEGE